MDNSSVTQRNLLAAFQIFDQDKDGYITKNELRSVMESLGKQPSDEDLQDIINENDLDCDGTQSGNRMIDAIFSVL